MLDEKQLSRPGFLVKRNDQSATSAIDVVGRVNFCRVWFSEIRSVSVWREVCAEVDARLREFSDAARRNGRSIARGDAGLEKWAGAQGERQRLKMSTSLEWFDN